MFSRVNEVGELHVHAIDKICRCTLCSIEFKIYMNVLHVQSSPRKRHSHWRSFSIDYFVGPPVRPKRFENLNYSYFIRLVLFNSYLAWQWQTFFLGCLCLLYFLGLPLIMINVDDDSSMSNIETSLINVNDWYLPNQC